MCALEGIPACADLRFAKGFGKARASAGREPRTYSVSRTKWAA